MPTSGNATGGNDVFNGKNRVFWVVDHQDITDGGHGSTTVNWSWAVNWAAGDNCHTILNGHVVINSVTVYGIVSDVHDFNASHVHTGDWPSGSGFGSGLYKIYHDSNGQANITLTGSHVGTSGATSTASNTWALPDIVQTPSAPTSVTGTRVSDTQMTVGWTNNSTTHHEYAGVKVYRSTDGGGYALIATLGVATSYSDTGVSANHKYTYKVQAYNDAGTADSSASSAVWTTPGAPTSCTATKQPNNDVIVSWTNNVNYSEYLIEVQESTNGGSTFSNLSTSVASGSTSYTHVAPNTSLTHIYRVRAKTSSGTTLNSSYSANSNTITLLSTANPPTSLSPAGVAKDATGSIVFTWVHNPTDGTPQSKYQLQYKVDAGSYTTVGPTTSSTSSYTMSGATLSNGHTITWHVATAGQNGTLSSYSSDSTFTTSAVPTVTFSAPGSTYSGSHLTASWTYFQAQSSAQASWVCQLYDNSSNLLESLSGTTESSATFTTALSNSTSYTVKVQVTSAAGLTSALTSQTFTTSFLPPAASIISASYDQPSGSMVLVVVGSSAVSGVTVNIDHVDIQRSIDGGGWVTIASGIVLTYDGVNTSATVLDTKPALNGTDSYRVISYSSLPSSVTSASVDVSPDPDGWCFLSGGDGFASILRCRAQPTLNVTTNRAAQTYHFAGRTLPVSLTGQALDYTLSVTATLTSESSQASDFELLASIGGVMLWRDPIGRRFFASLGQLTTSQSDKFTSQVTFQLTEVDYAE